MKLVILFSLFYLAYGSMVAPETPRLPCQNAMYSEFPGKSMTPAINTTARGYGRLGFRKNYTEIYYELIALGFSSKVISTTLHSGRSETNGPEKILLKVYDGAQEDGLWFAEGIIKLESSLVKAISYEEAYITVETKKYPTGEIGGTIYCSNHTPFICSCESEETPIKNLKPPSDTPINSNDLK